MRKRQRRERERERERNRETLYLPILGLYQSIVISREEREREERFFLFPSVFICRFPGSSSGKLKEKWRELGSLAAICIAYSSTGSIEATSV